MFQIDLSGKTVLITGASSGIGLGVAKMLAKAGANISGCGLENNGSEFINEVENQGGQAQYSICDVTKKEELQKLVQDTIEKFGQIDILISNAGGNIFEGLEDCDDEHWTQNIDLNLASHWRLAKLCKPYLQKNNGVIIIMTSNHAYSSIPGCFPYNVAKTALTGLVRSMAIEWSPEIRTVGLAPGFIDTPGNQEWFNSFPDPQKERTRTVNMHPVKKLGTTDEIGAWCVFLASSYAAFASGTTYLIDGGRSALMQENSI
ncbi:NAD(P)-dependent dehydrogenase, short-chain alcohol dehydrogenase family [Mucilaginibacter lappiensis]|uniref:NAD(P)-dependent dehydrogenase (Short-subunit alcohol dehydrogenase family) n=1 Tax=Mucilaginibacter lappiensis TaxID=354630 RepID=A0ABR6PCU0_9SPHI|nr:SDR family oxidoreductase [Mucilaginibacter lappiensis]MBB6107559.1 NAD(P)-dependent dehydrogenase (short-subunit alcohol dehydrogenase family) [Mucilaginibacter lappiensis]SIQ04394.1 NAD(P)-dependent dehydrogenase, short-chain alcohol dehydrogenase family [Mucilaginibacter lappiensis]